MTSPTVTDGPVALTEDEERDALRSAGKALEILQQDRDETLLVIEEYLQGNHPGPYIPNQSSTEYMLLAKRSITNLLPLVLNAPAQALYVEGHRLAGDTESSPAWQCWQNNRLDGRQASVYRSALSYGQSFVAVENRNGKAKALLLSPLYTTALYEDPVNDDFPALVLNVMRFASSDGGPGKARMWDANYYYVLELAYGGVITVVSRVEHGFSDTPVVPFNPYRDLEGRPHGIIQPILPLQDRVNQTVFDLLLGQTYTSHEVRYATGLVPPPKTQRVAITKSEALASGKIDPGDLRFIGMADDATIGYRYEKILDADGNPVPEEIQYRPGSFLTIKDPTAKVGSLPAGDLTGIIRSLETSVHHVAAISQIPVHFLLGNLANLSADALAVAESSLWRMVAELQHSFGESWEKVFQLFAEVEGLDGADDSNSEVRWRDTSAKSIGAIVDAITKGVQMADIPIQAAWEMWPGVTDGDLARWRELKDEEIAEYEADPESAVYRSVSPANMQVVSQLRGNQGGRTV